MSPNVRQQKIRRKIVKRKEGQAGPTSALWLSTVHCVTLSLFLVKVVVLPIVKVVTIFVKVVTICCESFHCFCFLQKFSEANVDIG